MTLGRSLKYMPKVGWPTTKLKTYSVRKSATFLHRTLFGISTIVMDGESSKTQKADFTNADALWRFSICTFLSFYVSFIEIEWINHLSVNLSLWINCTNSIFLKIYKFHK
jgi:hypothetical protein